MKPDAYHILGEKIHPIYSGEKLHGEPIPAEQYDSISAIEVDDLSSFSFVLDGDDVLDELFSFVFDELKDVSPIIPSRELLADAHNTVESWRNNVLELRKYRAEHDEFDNDDYDYDY